MCYQFFGPTTVDGTNFARTSMIRIRRAADAGAANRDRGLPALLDLHTGRDATPAACSYASHYPLVDSVWNGEGFDFNGSPAYWLVEIASRIHGQSGDLLGASVAYAFKGMLFGMTDRNSVWSEAMWRAWDTMNITATTHGVYGWWDVDGTPVTIVNGSTCGSLPPNPGSCNWTVTLDGYNDGTPCSAPSGNLQCFSGASLADQQSSCCASDRCGGFSFAPSTGDGCQKNDIGCFHQSTVYNGYTKPGFVPPPDPNSAVLATTYSAYGSHAIVVLASWCQQESVVTLAVNWDDLGINPAQAAVTAPAIDGIQPAENFTHATGPFRVAPGAGIVIYIRGV